MSEEMNSAISRRDVMTKLGAGIAGAMVGSAMAQGAEAQEGAVQGGGGRDTVAPFVDPTTKYPPPPYDTTQQPWPGLASKMQPPPDHGETSYKGSGRLMGRKALITGATPAWGGRRRLRMRAKVLMWRLSTTPAKSRMRRRLRSW